MPASFSAKTLEVLGDIGTNATNIRLLEGCLHQLVPLVGAGLSIEYGYPMWGQFLAETADKFGVRSELNSLLANYQYEEAAELLKRQRPQALDDELQLRFDHKRLPRPLRQGAVRHLPRIAHGLVLTTNFDRVLETAFEDAGRRFEEVFSGTLIKRASRAIQLGQPFLLKLHGDYLQLEDRILTLTEYAQEYGSADPGSIDFDRPLPKVLGQVLGARPLLFLGCSLTRDRTTLVIRAIAEKWPGIMHFALLADSENTAERMAQFDACNIRPLFFPKGQYEKVEQFLACLAEFIPDGRGIVDLPRPVPPTCLDGFVPRREELNEAKGKLLRGSHAATAARSVALVGPVGYGKTTLARALCADPEIKDAFGDGILWIDVGQNPDILRDLGSLYQEVTGSHPAHGRRDGSGYLGRQRAQEPVGSTSHR